MSKMKDIGSMMTVNELSKLTGLSIRTLHYYDEIGLLSAVSQTASGYRLYDETSLKMLQEIMLYRELQFPLKEIGMMIKTPGFDIHKALDDQIKMLELKRDHLDRLIYHAEQLKIKEELKMDFSVYDNSKMENYKKLAREAWGDTPAFKEYEEKTGNNTDVDNRRNAEGLMSLFFEFGDLKELEPGDPRVQDQVAKLQNYITDKYYTCTKAILAGLGQMYAAGGEMTDNINVAGGKGCAEFVAEAIKVYTQE